MKKNLNIIDYIIESKKLNQGKISEELGVSQAQISKWKTGEKISNKSELKLIELAGLNNHCEKFTIDNADSKWAILTRKHCDGQAWLDYLTALVYSHQIWDFKKNDILAEDELTSWIKNFLFLLNEGDVELPKAPIEAPSAFSGEESVFETFHSLSFFQSIDIIFQNIKTLQKQIIATFPEEFKKSKYFWKILDSIPSSSINKRLRYEEKNWGTMIDTPLISDIFGSLSFQNTYSKKIDTLIEEFEFKLRPFDIEFDWKKLSSQMCGAEYIQEQKIFDERQAIKANARNLIKFQEEQMKTKLENQNSQISKIVSNQSDDIDKDDSDKYLSLAERKITNQLKNQAEEIKELHSKVDSLLNLLSTTTLGSK